jgi:hypothetical protein
MLAVSSHCVSPNTHTQSTRDETIRAIRQLPPSFPEFMSPGLVDYISRALVKPADQRSSLSDLMRHPWILGHARCALARMVDPSCCCWWFLQANSMSAQQAACILHRGVRLPTLCRAVLC